MNTLKVLVFFALLSCAFSSTAQNYAAQKYYEMNQYKKAKATYITGLKTNNSAIDWLHLGKIYSIEGNKDSAKTCYSNVAAALPDSPLAIVAGASVQIISGNKAQAKIDLGKAIKIATARKDVQAFIEIAQVLFEAGDSTGWIDCLNQASQLDSKNPLPFIVAGNIYAAMNNNASGISALGNASGRYEQALYFDPQNVNAMNALASIYMRIQSFDDAEKYLNSLMALDSNYIPALRNFGELSYSIGNYSKASYYYGRYFSLAEYSDADQLRYIIILYFNNEFEKSNNLIQPLLKHDPFNPVLNRLNGYTLYELGKYNEGLEAMNAFFNIRKSASDTSKIIATDYAYLGKLQAKTGNDSLCITNLLKAISMDPATTAKLYEDMAKCYEHQKKYLSAIDSYNNLIKASNGDVTSATYFSIGKNYLILINDSTLDSLKKNEYINNADSAFTKVISISPSSHLGFLWHARAMAAKDPETTLGLAKYDYENTLTILEAKSNNDKYKNELIECYRYLGYFYFIKYESAKKEINQESADSFKGLSVTYWNKLLSVDPSNEVASQALKALNM